MYPLIYTASSSWRFTSDYIYIPHVTPIAKFIGPTWGPAKAGKTQVGPMFAPWIMLSGTIWHKGFSIILIQGYIYIYIYIYMILPLVVMDKMSYTLQTTIYSIGCSWSGIKDSKTKDGHSLLAYRSVTIAVFASVTPLTQLIMRSYDLADGIDLDSPWIHVCENL